MEHFNLRDCRAGRYVVRVEFMGFATVTQEVVLNPEKPPPAKWKRS